MDIKFHPENCQHIIIDNFLSDFDLERFNAAFKHCCKYAVDGDYILDNKSVVGKMFKRRKEFHAYQIAQQDPVAKTIVQVWRDNFWSEEIRDFLAKTGGIFAYANITTADNILCSYYKLGEFYKAHHDFAILTALFMHNDENNFAGGDFMLGDSVFHDDVRYKRIPYKNNRVIIFPARYIHYAEPVLDSYKEGLDGCRFTSQNFLTIH